ncbi:hypothetical protein ScPMuIL_004945 [Solemya velum]
MVLSTRLHTSTSEQFGAGPNLRWCIKKMNTFTFTMFAMWIAVTVTLGEQPTDETQCDPETEFWDIHSDLCLPCADICDGRHEKRNVGTMQVIVSELPVQCTQGEWSHYRPRDRQLEP